MTKLKRFIVAQIVLGSLVGFFASRFLPFSIGELFVAFYFGLAASHLSLLGFWAGMSLAAWWKRLLGFFAGVTSLWVIFFFVMEITVFPDPEIWAYMFAITSVIAGGVAMTSLLRRLFGIRLQRISEEEQSPNMQFTIRNLFMVTLCAAILLLVGRTTLDDSLYSFRMEVLVCAEVSFVIMLATLLCMWAALSLASPILPTVLSIVVILLMSLVVPWSTTADLIDMMPLYIILLSHFGWTLATLLVLRSYGYRLTSKEPNHLTKTVST